jgi:methylated-DNA-[protein]-cysteine S-methyltransferase
MAAVALVRRHAPVARGSDRADKEDSVTSPKAPAACTVDTPAGPFTTVVAHDGAVLAAGWTADLAELRPQVASALWPDEIPFRTDLGDVTRAVLAYHSGDDLQAVDEIEVRQRSGEFREYAWRVLRTVPPGKPITYTEYAARAGRPAAVRAAASACAYNAAALFVPCHRVLRTDGTLGGFRWGLPVKQWLLIHESTN